MPVWLVLEGRTGHNLRAIQRLSISSRLDYLVLHFIFSTKTVAFYHSCDTVEFKLRSST